MITASQLTAAVSTSGVDVAKAQLKDMGDATKSTGNIFKSALGAGLSFAAGVAGQAFDFLKDTLVDSIKVAMTHQQVMAQTAQAIKSTGDASGLSAAAIGNLADQLSQVTPFSDNVTQSGENLLLTFTGIGKQVFPMATQSMLDMAQAMHIGPTQEALTLGKALNDPTTGLSALTRVGVAFSAQEQEQIKTMMKHNDIIGAQKIMLHELNTEFGGSAQAAGKTLAGALTILGNQWDDLKQKIGMAVIPVLQQFLSLVDSVAMPVLEKLGDWFQNVAGPALSKFGGLVASAFQSTSMTVFFNAAEQLASQLGYLFNVIWQTAGLLAGAFGLSLSGASDKAKSLGSGALISLSNTLQNLTLDIHNAAIWLQQFDFSEIIAGAKQAASTFNADFGPALKNIAGLLGGQFKQTLRDVSTDAQQFGKWFESSVVPALQKAEPGFLQLGKVVLTDVLPALIQLRGIATDVIQHALETFGPVLAKIIPPLVVLSGQIAGGLAVALKFLMPYILDAVHAIGQFADEIMTRVAPIVGQFFSDMENGLNDFMKIWKVVWPYLAPIVEGVWKEIQGLVKIAWSVIKGIIEIGLDILGGNWKQAWTDFKTMLAGIWDGIKTYLSGAWEIIKGLFSDALKAVQDIWDGIGDWFDKNVIDPIKNTFSGLGSLASQWGSDLINGLKNAINAGVNDVKDAASNVGKAISSVLHFSKPDIGPLVNVDQWMPDFMSMLSEGMNQNIGKVKLASLNVASNISSPLHGGLNVGAAFSTPSTTLQGSNAAQQPIILQIDGQVFGRIMMPLVVNQIRNKTGVRI
jgi:hypothetical protein